MIEQGIYKIINLVNGKFYIGSSKNLMKRWGDHLYRLRNNKHLNKHLQNAYNKYGESSFAFVIIESNNTWNEKELREKEQEYLDYYFKTCPESFYNMAPKAVGGNSTNFSEEALRSISEKNRKLSNEELEEVKEKILLGISKKEIAKQYNIRAATLSSVLNSSCPEFTQAYITRQRILKTIQLYNEGWSYKEIAKRLNTLYVDKSLKYHDLIQAFSRTNRVESETKPFGNIVCYRTTKERVDEAVKLFSQTDSIDTVIMAPYEDYLNKFKVAVSELLKITPVVDSVDSLEREEDIKAFIVAFRTVAKLLVSLKTFNEFDLDNGDTELNAQMFEDYKSKYYELYRRLSNDKEKSSILNDITFSLELIQTDKINVSYILNLIRNIDLTNEIQKLQDIENIERKLANSTDDDLRSKTDLIKSFLKSILPTLKEDDSIDEALNNHMNVEREKEIEKFSEDNNINLDNLKEIIDEYEYSGIFPDSLIGKSIDAPFLKKISIIENIKVFIRNLLKKYM